MLSLLFISQDNYCLAALRGGTPLNINFQWKESGEKRSGRGTIGRHEQGVGGSEKVQHFPTLLKSPAANAMRPNKGVFLQQRWLTKILG